MTTPELRFLFLFAGLPTFAASKTFSNYDRRICEQIVAHLGWLPCAEDVEYVDSVEREIELSEIKYGEPYDETR